MLRDPHKRGWSDSAASPNDPQSLIDAWAQRLNAPPKEIERAIWAVGYDVDAVKEFIEDWRRDAAG
jgi:hypothetical protein